MSELNSSAAASGHQRSGERECCTSSNQQLFTRGERLVCLVGAASGLAFGEGMGMAFFRTLTPGTL